MKEIKLPKKEMLMLIEAELKKELKNATQFLPVNDVVIEKIDWTAEGISIWIQE